MKLGTIFLENDILHIQYLFVYCLFQPTQISVDDNILVSRYINNPLLIDGKFI